MINRVLENKRKCYETLFNQYTFQFNNKITDCCTLHNFTIKTLHHQNVINSYRVEQFKNLQTRKHFNSALDTHYRAKKTTTLNFYETTTKPKYQLQHSQMCISTCARLGHKINKTSSKYSPINTKYVSATASGKTCSIRQHTQRVR